MGGHVTRYNGITVTGLIVGGTIMENEQGAPLAQPSTNSVGQSSAPSHHGGDTQEEFNKAVPVIKQKFYEKGYQDAYKEAEDKFKQSGEYVSKTEVQRMLDEREAKAKADAEAAQTAAYTSQWQADLEKKVAEAKPRYEDYDSVVNAAFVNTAPQVVVLSQMFPNAGDMLYELGSPENSALLTEMIVLSNSKDLTRAQQKLQQLSDSIANNQKSAALKAKLPPAPFAKIKPSSVNLSSGNAEDNKQAYFRNIKF